jgi:hypothetical protein
MYKKQYFSKKLLLSIDILLSYKLAISLGGKMCCLKLALYILTSYCYKQVGSPTSLRESSVLCPNNLSDMFRGFTQLLYGNTENVQHNSTSIFLPNNFLVIVGILRMKCRDSCCSRVMIYRVFFPA